jgi:hypothetical protein
MTDKFRFERFLRVRGCELITMKNAKRKFINKVTQMTISIASLPLVVVRSLELPFAEVVVLRRGGAPAMDVDRRLNRTPWE